MRTPMRNMRGFTVINLIIIAIVIVFTLTFAIRLVPPYLQHYAINNALADMAANPELLHMPKAKMRDLLARKLQVNYINNVTPEALVLTKKGEDTYLSLKYEVRVHLVANMDAILMFDEEVRVDKSAKF